MLRHWDPPPHSAKRFAARRRGSRARLRSPDLNSKNPGLTNDQALEDASPRTGEQNKEDEEDVDWVLKTAQHRCPRPAGHRGRTPGRRQLVSPAMGPHAAISDAEPSSSITRGPPTAMGAATRPCASIKTADGVPVACSARPVLNPSSVTTVELSPRLRLASTLPERDHDEGWVTGCSFGLPRLQVGQQALTESAPRIPEQHSHA